MLEGRLSSGGERERVLLICGLALSFCVLEGATDSSGVEELGLVDKLVANHSVHALGRHVVVAQFDVFILVLVIHRSKTLVVAQDLGPIGLLVSHISVVLSVQLNLTGFERTEGLVARRLGI